MGTADCRSQSPSACCASEEKGEEEAQLLRQKPYKVQDGWSNFRLHSSSVSRVKGLQGVSWPCATRQHTEASTRRRRRVVYMMLDAVLVHWA